MLACGGWPALLSQPTDCMNAPLTVSDSVGRSTANRAASILRSQTARRERELCTVLYCAVPYRTVPQGRRNSGVRMRSHTQGTICFIIDAWRLGSVTTFGFAKHSLLLPTWRVATWLLPCGIGLAALTYGCVCGVGSRLRSPSRVLPSQNGLRSHHS